MVIATVYHWKVEKGKEQAFEQAWSQATKDIYKKRGSLGSSLHKHKDGTYYAYARWPSKMKRTTMLLLPPYKKRMPMATLLEEPIVLELKEDYLRKKPKKT
ncbi:MAG: antibiotic biosynthesis monooxygenase [Candidatus Woesearchaeota archaeon]|nr:antibiotic biosynthesis monooxygenase [Candidatus Woesearchaeota archaeon]